ncbi:hypothetical protein QCA50_020309 [Cerrena zonata]|uniref:Uncharacterized protein n=1 Tax=Cerrena zonata TaxID=2478898 RepID=A0AAW0F8A4_9APHY
MQAIHPESAVYPGPEVQSTVTESVEEVNPGNAGRSLDYRRPLSTNCTPIVAFKFSVTLIYIPRKISVIHQLLLIMLQATVLLVSCTHLLDFLPSVQYLLSLPRIIITHYDISAPVPASSMLECIISAGWKLRNRCTCSNHLSL